jgi:hypothetical protein
MSSWAGVVTLLFTDRFARLELAGEPRRRPGLALRGLDSLPLRFTPRRFRS